MKHRDDGESLVHRFLSDHVQRLGRLTAAERDNLLDAVRQLGSAWGLHKQAATEQDRTRALREVDAAMLELDLLAERVTATHSDSELAHALRTLSV